MKAAPSIHSGPVCDCFPVQIWTFNQKHSNILETVTAFVVKIIIVNSWDHSYGVVLIYYNSIVSFYIFFKANPQQKICCCHRLLKDKTTDVQKTYKVTERCVTFSLAHFVTGIFLQLAFFQIGTGKN